MVETGAIAAGLGSGVSRWIGVKSSLDKVEQSVIRKVRFIGLGRHSGKNYQGSLSVLTCGQCSRALPSLKPLAWI